MYYVAICGRICLIVRKSVCRTLNEDGKVVTVTPEELVETSANAVTFYLENGDQTEVKATTSFIYGDESASENEL